MEAVKAVTKGVYLLARVTNAGKLGANGNMPIRVWPLEDEILKAHTAVTKNVSLSRADLDGRNITELTIWHAPAEIVDKKPLKVGDIIVGHFDITKCVVAKAHDPADPTGKAKVERVKMKNNEPVLDNSGEFIVLKSVTLAPTKAKDVQIKRSATLEEAVKIVTDIPGLE